MFGSDWPVCLVACPYGRWVDVIKKRIANLTDTEQRRILGETAVETYKL
jgi:L-fuconolactonase